MVMIMTTSNLCYCVPKMVPIVLFSFLWNLPFYQPAAVDNDLHLLFFDEIEVWVENLVRLDARNLLNLNCEL